MRNQSPLPFTLRQLQYVVAVAETGGFRRAAEHCHVSQPSLSAQVAEVERALGVVLFERRPRRVLPTPAGAALVERARRLLVDAGELAAAARRLDDPLAGTLRVGVIPTVGPYLLPEIDPALREAFERLELVWREDRTAGLVRAIEGGDLDAAIVALESDLGSLEHRRLGRDPFVLALPPGHRLARGRGRVDLGALGGERVLLLDDGHCLRDQALSICSTVGVVEPGFRATSLPTLVQMVAGGLGVTLLPQMAVEAETRHRALRIRRLAEPEPARTVVLVWRPRSPLAGAFGRLVDVARASARSVT